MHLLQVPSHQMKIVLTKQTVSRTIVSVIFVKYRITYVVDQNRPLIQPLVLVSNNSAGVSGLLYLLSTDSVSLEMREKNGG